ncbi:MAG TPA: DNA methyltransferase [Ignavibacteria bacterium]|nr:DNA methyltransferase [Ignavibacteria bacterium]
MQSSQKLLKDFNFKLLNSPDFKEDSVREEIILPILKALGYNSQNIIRSKNLLHPFLKIGSKKRPITIIPDYLLKVKDNFAFVLDAKAPNEQITQGDNVEQVFSYAIHPEIRAKYFALSNGREFILFRQDIEKPLIYCNVKDINKYWEQLYKYLSPESFQTGKEIIYTPVIEKSKEEKFDYLKRPLLEEIPVKKRAAKRHFGVHGYFTKQSWNIVAEYIKNFSQPGDIILDPYGGSGVTLIEALMNDRKAIHIDLNPMSVFIVSSLIAPVKEREFLDAFDRVKNSYVKNEPKSKEEIKQALKKYPYPKGFILPKSSDVEKIEDLFSDKQLAQLAFLKHLINKEKNNNIRNSLLLAFSSSVNKANLTYHHSTYASENAGNSGPMMYYRYRLAPQIVNLDLMETFTKKFSAVLNAKREIQYKINEQTISNASIYKGTATDLKQIKSESIDYIYTDPPYGNKIPYLDLSVMWNAWLDLEVTKKDRQLEAIEGGEQEKTKQEYSELIAKSIEEMYRVLKFDRWMSFVFAHKDPELWHLILDSAERAGFEYAGAVKQANGQTSFKKRQHPFTVLAGQLIINFKKVKNPKAILKAHLGMDISEIILQTVEGVIAQHNGATLEQINDELVIKGLELGFLDLLKKEYSDLTPILLDSFDYDDDTELFTLKKNAKFKTHVDIHLRIKYYLISYLRRQKLENKFPTLEQIVFHIMPLLRNGVTPEHQTILNVLETVAVRHGADTWKIKEHGQFELF